MRQNKNKFQPPKWIDTFLQWGLPEEQFEEVQGDMHELYGKWVQEIGVHKANWLYSLNALTFLRPLPRRTEAQKPIYSYTQTNPFDMIRNYLIIAFRNM